MSTLGFIPEVRERLPGLVELWISTDWVRPKLDLSPPAWDSVEVSLSPLVWGSALLALDLKEDENFVESKGFDRVEFWPSRLEVVAISYEEGKNTLICTDV